MLSIKPFKTYTICVGGKNTALSQIRCISAVFNDGILRQIIKPKRKCRDCHMSRSIEHWQYSAF